MKLHQPQYLIAMMSEVLVISPSGYCASLNHEPSARVQRDAMLEMHVKTAHEATRHT